MNKFTLDKPSNFQVSGCWESDIDKRSFLHKRCRKYLEESVFNTEEVSDLTTQIHRLNATSTEGYPCRNCGQTFVHILCIINVLHYFLDPQILQDNSSNQVLNVSHYLPPNPMLLEQHVRSYM